MKLTIQELKLNQNKTMEILCNHDFHSLWQFYFDININKQNILI